MKHISAFLLSAVLLLSLLAGCNRQPTTGPNQTYTAIELAEAALSFSGRDNSLELERLNADMDGELLNAYIENAYGLPEGQWTDAAVIRGMGTSAFEIAVLRFPDEDAAKDGADHLDEYLHSREGDFTGYAPEQADMVSNGRDRQKGVYVGLFICPAPDEADAAFLRALNGEEQTENPNSESGPSMQDLLFRLLSTACPELPSISSAWSQRPTGNLSDSAWFFQDVARVSGVSSDMYIDCAIAEWDYELSWNEFESSFDQFVNQRLIVFKAASETAAKALLQPMDDYLKSEAELCLTRGETDKAELLQNAQTVQFQEYAAMIVSEYAEEAASDFPSAVTDAHTNGWYERWIGVSDPATSGSTPEPGPVTDMESLKDTMVYHCRNELNELGSCNISTFGSDEDFPQAVEDAYGIPASQLADGFIIHGPDDSLFEVIVLRMVDQDAAQQHLDMFRAYKDSAKDRYTTLDDEGIQYIDSENWDSYTYVSQAVLIQDGEFLALLTCQDPQGARNTLGNALKSLRISERPQTDPASSQPPAGIPTFEEVSWIEPVGEPDPDHPNRIKFVSPNLDDMSLYDTSAIRTAWSTGDPTPLSGPDREIYDAAKAVLDEILTDGMSSYDKEAAIYAWVVQNVGYDWTHQDIMAETPRESFGPYGGLVNHSAVCLGYATSFQLLADLSGLECITVVGASFSSEEDHAWNMVRLDGNWYCLDTTWDANAREQGLYPDGWTWRFFNVTSDYMARSNHQWDYANIPEAVTEGHGAEYRF